MGQERQCLQRFLRAQKTLNPHMLWKLMVLWRYIIDFKNYSSLWRTKLEYIYYWEFHLFTMQVQFIELYLTTWSRNNEKQHFPMCLVRPAGFECLRYSVWILPVLVEPCSLKIKISLIMANINQMFSFLESHGLSRILGISFDLVLVWPIRSF